MINGKVMRNYDQMYVGGGRKNKCTFITINAHKYIFSYVNIYLCSYCDHKANN